MTKVALATIKITEGQRENHSFAIEYLDNFFAHAVCARVFHEKVHVKGFHLSEMCVIGSAISRGFWVSMAGCETNLREKTQTLTPL